MKVFYLNNPAAGHNNGKKLYPSILEALKKRGIEFDTVQTEFAGHGITIVSSIDFKKYDAILISGGDGTLFEALNGYFANKSAKRIPFGIIPIGRGNALARDLNLFPEKWEEALDTIKFGYTKKIDVGTFTSSGKVFYFINILGFGFVTDIASTAYKLRIFGDLSYILGVFYQTINLKSYQLTLEADGKIYERENVFVEISNSRYTGKDFLMAPSAKIDDGFLDVTLLNKLNRRRVLQCLPKIFTGTHGTMKEVEIFQAKHLIINTSSPKRLTPDGQLLGTTPIEVKCLPKALEVFFNA